MGKNSEKTKKSYPIKIKSPFDYEKLVNSFCKLVEIEKTVRGEPGKLEIMHYHDTTDKILAELDEEEIANE